MPPTTGASASGARDRCRPVALAATADVVLDSQAMGVDLSALRAANPGLVTVTINAFGETGPKADWLASDLTLAAASGHLALTGDHDRAPVRISEPQVFHHAALEAAIAAIVALAARERTGEGQHIDVSAQQAFRCKPPRGPCSRPRSERTPSSGAPAAYDSAPTTSGSCTRRGTGTCRSRSCSAT